MTEVSKRQKRSAICRAKRKTKEMINLPLRVVLQSMSTPRTRPLKKSQRTKQTSTCHARKVNQRTVKRVRSIPMTSSANQSR